MPGKFHFLWLVLMLGFACKDSAQVADPTPNPELAYQGRLTEANTLVNGARSFVFSILDSTGDELWNSGTQTITVVEGLYGVVLGATGMPVLPGSLTLRANLHLHVVADGVTLSPDVSLIPALQSSTTWNVIGPFFGDVSGTQQSISVDKLKGIPINLVALTAGQVLTFDGTSWTASDGSSGRGPQGPDGATGATGASGPPGASGSVGATGATGPQGATGAAGTTGGTNGSGFNFRNAFDAGASYAIDDVATFNGSTYVAIVASAGPNNATPNLNPSAWSVMAQEGAAGAAGTAGAQGQAGTSGAAGATGGTGATGAPGLQGPAGVTGAQGPTGATGTNGTGFNFRNAFDASASYAIDDVATFNGSTYVAIVASAGPNNATPNLNPSAWSVMAQEGAAGAAGAAGAQGQTGTSGAAGATGGTGATGSPGLQGPAGASPFTLDGSNAVFTTGSVGIGIDPPNATAALDLTSTTQGLLAPRMTTTQRLAIASPANGLIVYDTVLKSLEVYDTVAAVWNQLADTATTGSVTSVTAAAPLTVTSGTSTPAIGLGTVPVANGGTGAATLTGYLLGSGASPVTASASIPGTAVSGNIAGSAASVTGTVALANGGTGATTATAAITNLLPSQTGYSGKVLTTSGTVASWAAGASGTVTSVTATSPITIVTGTSTPAITLGTVPVVNGGTGAATFVQGQILFGTTTTPISSSSALFWNSTLNRLGIGTSSPSFPLDVEASVSANIATYSFMNSTAQVSNNTGGTSAPIGIYASNRMVANEFDAISDARIKNVIGPSDMASDLGTLEKFKIRDFRYVDLVGKGNRSKKGVIAQELEKVYPDAVRMTYDFIPSVYAMANDVRYNAATHELTITVPKAHGFAVGNIVRIITDAGNVDKPVASVADDQAFVLADFPNDPGKVFVFGKKVDDFRVVDYDQLFSMNISATQQLAVENRDLKARIAALERAVSALQERK
jgi:hypothetical protein